MNFRTIILGIIIGYVAYKIYCYMTSYTIIKNNKKPNNLETFEQNLTSPKALPINSKKNKHVTFCDIVDVNEIFQEKKYNDNVDNIISNKDLDKLMDDLIDYPINEINDVNNNKPIKSLELISNTNREKMFDEIENKINQLYTKNNTVNGLYLGIDRPVMSDAIPNSDDIKNSDVNPVLNPNWYHQEGEEDETLWEMYDRLTTNNHKQYSSLENMNPREISDNFRLGNNKEYGMTKFDKYSLT
jgi:hypothetical protein